MRHGNSIPPELSLFRSSESPTVNTRQRVQFVLNARMAGRLHVGPLLRGFLSGTVPEVPTGCAGVPAAKK